MFTDLFHELHATLASNANEAVEWRHVLFFEALEARREGGSLQDLRCGAEIVVENQQIARRIPS